MTYEYHRITSTAITLAHLVSYLLDNMNLILDIHTAQHHKEQKKTHTPCETVTARPISPNTPNTPRTQHSNTSTLQHPNTQHPNTLPLQHSTTPTHRHFNTEQPPSRCILGRAVGRRHPGRAGQGQAPRRTTWRVVPRQRWRHSFNGNGMGT